MDSKIRKVVKRSGNVEDFNIDKIYKVIDKAAHQTKEFTYSENGKQDESVKLVKNVVDNSMDILYSKVTDNKISVEDIQESVEEALMCCGMYKTAKKFIIYPYTIKHTAPNPFYPSYINN